SSATLPPSGACRAAGQQGDQHHGRTDLAHRFSPSSSGTGRTFLWANVSAPVTIVVRVMLIALTTAS
ncbi:hypothetical protein, partial [Bradyrhizobium sp. 132]|uniref:hypothetical protein n=1 Tax=Bradyrhizobium sp. 132 TaxID=2782610 RepID=UPI001FFA4998